MPNATYVVAHADDETLWFLPEPGDEVIVCSTPTRDLARARQFERACEILGVRGIMHGQPDVRDGAAVRLDLSFLKTALVGARKIVTHNRHGEYGHPQHVQVSTACDLHAGRLSTLHFGYGVQCSGVRELSDEQFDRKVAALQCYDSPVGKLGPTWRVCVDKYFDGKLENLRSERYLAV